MGMRIGSSAATNASSTTGIGNWQQRQQGIKNLFAALQSGDLPTAKASFAGLSGAGSGVNPNSALGQIGQALQGGDLAGAQKAAQSMRGDHGGHHHRAATVTAPLTAAPGGLLDAMA